MAEHSAVNRRVVSSSLTWGAMFKLRYLCNIGVFIFLAFMFGVANGGFTWKAAAISPSSSLLLSLFSVRENLPVSAGYSNHESWGLQAAPQARWCTDQRRSVHIQGRLIPTSG